MNQNFTRLGRITALLALGGAALYSQGVQTGTISGTVRSAAGRPIAGATVIVRTGQGDRTSVTDAAGQFRFGLLVPQPLVKISVSAKDYIGASVDSRINVDKNNVVDFALKPINVTGAVVEVISAGAKVDTSEAKSGQNVSLEDVNLLPINNRSITGIASLAPGTSSDSNGLVIRGSQATQVQYLVDGADVQDPVTGGPGVRLNEDMLEEVQVISGGASAEYGRFTGGVVNTVTKTGTNNYSGIFRIEASNLAWNAYNPLSRGAAGTFTYPNAHNVVQNYVVSGPILKDKLFFVVGYRTTSPKTSVPGTTSSPDFGGIPFVTTGVQDRKDIKLDWQITPSHKVFWQYNKTLNQNMNRDYPTLFGYGSTGIETLSAQADLFQYVTFGYQGQLANNLFLDVRMNHKKETLGSSAGTSGGQGSKTTPMWIDTQTFDVFDNGFFSNDGDSRPIRTANASLSWFFDAAGSHELKTGIQLFESKRNSANAQTPSNYMVYFDGFATPGSSAVSNRVMHLNNDTTSYLEWWEPITGATTKNRSDAFFVNDKWKVNSHWAFNLGLRFDKFNSKDDLGRDNFSFSTTSPRLAAIYDVNGDASSVWSVNYGVYQGNVIQGSTDAASPAGNPVQRDYYYIGGSVLKSDGSINLAAFDMAHPFYLDDPFTSRNTSVDPNLKAPRMTEISASYRQADAKGNTWSLGFTRRVYDHMVDDVKTVVAGVLKTVIKNDDTIKRDYTSIEAMFRSKLNENFDYGINATLSSMRGNYEGGQVGTTEARNNYGPSGPNINFLSPMGNLSADRPLYLVADTTYHRQLGPGRFTAGTLATYSSGAPYSLTGANALSGVALPYSQTYTKYFGARGNLRFPDTYRVDLALGYDMPVYQKATFFTKATITNLFNHQLLASWNTTGTTSSTGAWVAGSSYGRPTSSGNYITARTVTLAAGIRF